MPDGVGARRWGGAPGQIEHLAGEFHRFYNSCRIKGEAPEVLAARLKLSDTVRAVIANCLALLGVSAPEKM